MSRADVEMIRIQGLVRTFNKVRAQLQAGIPEGEIEMFREQVQGAVRQVEALCRRHGVAANDLPGPSRAAYRFLTDLDLDDLPVPPAGDQASAPSTLRLKNVANLEQHLAHKLWKQLPQLSQSDGERKRLEGEILRQATGIERICALRSATPSILALPSRQVYCWLKFLSGERNLALHVAALQRASDVLAGGGPGPGRPMEVQLLHMASLWRVRRDRDHVLLRVSEGFVNADETVWRAILSNCAGARVGTSEEAIREFADSEEFSEVIVEIESFAEPPAGSTRGRVHDLKDSFERVNRTYFWGRMPKPRLVWSRILTTTKLGHYRAAADTVMVAATLDTPGAPAQAVDLVMYHELLHKKHGAAIVNGRRLVHTAQFRADERRFNDYERVKHQLDELARGGRS